MPRIDSKYNELALADSYLTDNLLMTLAWKKSHQYIRTTNWYADNFELDLSALSLAETTQKWCSQISGRKRISFADLELVPAPKQYQWGFQADKPESSNEDERLYWYPKNDADDIPIRPLAHIPIREQSIMTLVMMCLANAVETKQGDPTTEFESVHEIGVVSYGNRLFCRYSDDGKAEHSYGATTIYSKFFTDNRRFLERPYHFAKQARSELNDDQEVLLVELDLSKFFDLVDREDLCKKIEEFSGQDNKLVRKVLNAFKKWKWTPQATQSFEKLCKSEQVTTAPHGIPQGLVAGGFLANIYLLDFDEHMQGMIGQPLGDSETEINLIDYCRYVDDMRLVVSAKSYESSSKAVKAFSTKTQYLDGLKIRIIESFEKTLINLKLENLILNKEKTKVEFYKPKIIGISGELNKIQKRLSGPIAFDDSQEYLKQLDSLLSNSNSIAIEQKPDVLTPNLLAEVEQRFMDVRDDSIKRFASNKISKILKVIRNFTSHPVDKNGKPMPCDWDYQQEQLARRLISCWSRDPSLVVLLKKGLELFPNEQLLEAVLEQLRSKLNDKHDKIKTIATYCLSEVFRHAATTIHRLDPKYIPLHANREEFFERLQHEAIRVCSDVKIDKNFDLLTQQAKFLLLVRLDTTLEDDMANDVDYGLITKLIKGFRKITLDKSLEPTKIATDILLANQISDNCHAKSLIRSVSSLFNNLEQEKIVKILSEIAKQDLDLLKSIVFHARPLGYEWCKTEKVKSIVNLYAIDKKALTKPFNKITGMQSLLRLALRQDNPFSNEITALKLMESLLKLAHVFESVTKEELIDISKTKISIENCHYSIPPKFELFNCSFQIDIAFTSDKNLSPHLSGDDWEIRALQRIAMCIRAVLIGSNDWSGFGLNHELRAGYRGIKSSSEKRSVGMINTPYAIAGEGATITCWLTTLLSKLLIWPGISVNNQDFNWPISWSIDNVMKLVQKRLDILQSRYCKLSEIPSLIESVKLDWKETKQSLTVAMVQSKLPSNIDFQKYGLMLDAPSFRSRHRRHVADVATLICKHIDAQRTSDSEREERGKQVDLIIWPELAVNHDDLDILISLSRKTHSIIYAGLSFIIQDNVEGPNNCAVWIVPPKADSEQKEIIRLQGKQNMMSDEQGKIKPWRPYQLFLELKHPKYPTETGFMLTGSICYDATDISLSADLRDKSNAYVVAALNKDVNTFDNMVDALHYHMFQPVVLVNSGVYGGSCAKAPYSEPYHRLIAHCHGNDQVSINTFEMNMFDFRRDAVGVGMRSDKAIKTQPAGIS